MKRGVRVIGLALLAVPLLSLAACGGDSSQASGSTVAASSQELSASLVLIDVRDPDEFAAGHLAGATNVPYNDGTLQANVGTFDPTVRYGVYCHSGRRSALSVAIMKDAGMTDVVDLGGIDAAAAATGLAIVTD